MFTPDYPISTERLVIRPYRHSDLDDLHAFQAHPDVVRYLYWEPRSREESLEFLEERLGHVTLKAPGERLGLALALKDTDRVIGDMTLFWHSELHRRGEIGFVLHPDHQGRGYAFEASRALLKLGFEALKLHRIIGQCDARNTASAGLLERLGMRREAHFHRADFFKGEWGDVYIYALLSDEWFAQLK